MTMRYKSDRRWEIAANIVMIGLVICTLFPFLLLISASFTDEVAAVNHGYSIIPPQFSLAAYKYVLQEWEQIGHAYLITIVVTVVGTALSLTITSLFAYGLSRKVPCVGIVNFLVVFSMLFNGGMVATYYTYSQILNVRNTIWALILPGYLMSAMTVMLFRNYFQTSIPASLVESAQLDGAGELTVFTKIMLPLSKPIFATMGLMGALGYWNDWTNGLYYLDEPELYGIQTVLNKINENATYLANNSTTAGMVAQNSNIPGNTMRMAMAILGILPILAVYPFFQDYFAKGITFGAVKG